MNISQVAANCPALSYVHDAIAHIFHKTSGLVQLKRHLPLAPLPHVKHKMFKVAASCASIYLCVMHMKLSLHTQAAITRWGLMPDLLPNFTSLHGLMLLRGIIYDTACFRGF